MRSVATSNADPACCTVSVSVNCGTIAQLCTFRAAKKINEEAQAANQGGKAVPMHVDLASLRYQTIRNELDPDGSRIYEQWHREISSWRALDTCCDSDMRLGQCRSVHSFAVEFQRRSTHLNVLVNNAGEFAPEDKLSEDGIQARFSADSLVNGECIIKA